MVQIIPICSFKRSVFKGLGKWTAVAFIASSICVPALATVESDAQLDRYFNARLAEIDNRDDEALKTYLLLLKTQPTSIVLPDRVLTSAIRSGNMASAAQAVRLLELSNGTRGEAPLILFADAFRRKDWSMAAVAITELEQRSNFAFAAPILQSWSNVAQGKSTDFPTTTSTADSVFSYYSSDQRVYFDLAAGDFSMAKTRLADFDRADEEFVRDLKIQAAGHFVARGDQVFALSLLNGQLERSDAGALLSGATSNQSLVTPAMGLAALHTRLATALLEQNVGDQALTLARIGNWLAPNNDATKLVLAKALADQGLYSQSGAVFNSVPLRSPYWSRAISDHARMLQDNKQSAKALALVKAASVAKPTSPQIALLLAQSYDAAGDLPASITAYTKLSNEADANGAAPRQRALYKTFLATAQDKSGDWASARQNLEAALAITPQNPFVLNYLGYGLLERGQDTERALGLVKQAYRSAPDSIAITDSLGWGYHLVGNQVAAVPLLEKAAKVSGNAIEINEHLGDAYWATGRLIDARYAWRIAAQTAVGKDAERLTHKIDFGLVAIPKSR